MNKLYPTVPGEKWTVYGLEDPRSGLIRYVGLTVSPRTRFSSHMTKARTKRPNEMRKWICRLQSLGVAPRMVALGIFYDPETARDAEGRFALFLRRLGHDLLNERGPFVSGISRLEAGRGAVWEQ